MDLDVVFRASRVVTPEGERACDVGVKDGVVVTLGQSLEAALLVELAEDEVLLPGLVDTHVHVNEPGRTEWEGFASATRAAAAGGVTTIIDMPLNSIPPTVDADALEVKRKAADGQCFVDVGFWGGAVPGNLGSLQPLHEAGVFGFKCFLVDSGVEEFAHLSEAALRAALSEIASLGSLLVVHAEDPLAIQAARPSTAYADFLASRPKAAENSAVALLAATAEETGCRVHIVHVSSADALPLIERSPLSGETCPHYLSFTAEEIADGATQFKCCPPIRDDSNREALWEGLRSGVIGMVVSDHSPSTVELKHLDTGDFATAWGGIASLQLGLPAVWTEAKRRGFTLPQVVGWMSSGPASLVGLQRKGSIVVGSDADLVIFAPEDAFVVEAVGLHHKNPVTPYDGRRLTGVVRSTWLRGRRIDVNTEPQGRLLTRGQS